MKQNPRSKANPKKTKTVLRLPDLEYAKAAVLNSLTSPDAQRGYTIRPAPAAVAAEGAHQDIQLGFLARLGSKLRDACAGCELHFLSKERGLTRERETREEIEMKLEGCVLRGTEGGREACPLSTGRTRVSGRRHPRPVVRPREGLLQSSCRRWEPLYTQQADLDA
jgi:hypothetical protein